MIVDFVDLNTMQPLGKIIVELNVDKLLSTLSLNQLYPSTVVIFSGAQGKRIGSLQTDLFRENEDMNKWYHASSSLRKSRAARWISIFQTPKSSPVCARVRVCIFSSVLPS